jgi:hypothetical protein
MATLTLNPASALPLGKTKLGADAIPFRRISARLLNRAIKSQTSTLPETPQVAKPRIAKAFDNAVDKQSPPPTPINECAVCFEEIPEGEYIVRRSPRFNTFLHRQDCPNGHRQMVCKTCTQHHVEAEFDAKGWDRITCPLCPKKLEHGMIKTLATPEFFAKLVIVSCQQRSIANRYRWNDIRQRKLREKDRNFRWCLRSGCKAGEVHKTGRKNPDIRCSTCSYRMCFRHQMPWHDGLTCSQYDDVEKADNKSVKLISYTSIKCPGKECPWNVTRSEGCNTMSCKCHYPNCS